MLRVDGLVAGHGRTLVLRRVTISAPEGGLVALLGGIGTGRSTALKDIAGLLRPEAGTIHPAGERIGGLQAKRLAARGLALVPQALVPWGKEVFAAMSVEEDLLMGGFQRRRDRRGLAADLEAVYEEGFPRLRGRWRVPPGQLSGGERQMLAIGRALMARPRVLLLLDGPSAALALRVVDEVAGAIPVLRAAGLTLLLVEQNVMVGLGLADHVHMLCDGRLAFERTVAEDFTAEGLRDLYLGGRTARPRQAATAACRR